jgi:hypothetical protein
MQCTARAMHPCVGPGGTRVNAETGKFLPSAPLLHLAAHFNDGHVRDAPLTVGSPAQAVE